jgi:hypothetical protein
MVHIPAALRQQVIERAGGRCEYCQTPRAIVVEMALDHIVPVAAGGETTADNMCLACVSCNARKLDFQEAVDPESGEAVLLFNPRTQQWADHFAWEEGGIRLVGLTAAGRATVEAGWHPPR